LLARGALAIAILGSVATHALAASCDPTGADAAAVSGARAAVHAACDCEGADRASTWRRCVRDTLRPLLASTLSSACERHVRRLEQRSTCGRPDRSVCCRTSRLGATTASLRRAGACRAPVGGSACESARPYQDEACLPGGCVPPPTVCGNGVVEIGETCDPPNGTTCGSTCALCPGWPGCAAPVCGNGIVEVPEECEPPGTTTCRPNCTACPPGECAAPVCGNGRVETGESCDPPNGHTCDATCTTCQPGTCATPACGNGSVEYGETCDPPNGTTCDDACITCPVTGCVVPGQRRFCGNGPVTAQCGFTLPTRAACEAEGGCWEPTEVYPAGVCNCPTLDAGKACREDDACEGLCVAPDCGWVGTCTATRFVLGCFCLLDDPGDPSYWCAH
jgi:hypothetical protein